MSSSKDGKERAQKEKRITSAYWTALGSVANLGFNMAVCIVGSFAFGHFLDNRLGTPPRLLIVFIIIGVIAAFKLLFEYALK